MKQLIFTICLILCISSQSFALYNVAPDYVSVTPTGSAGVYPITNLFDGDLGTGAGLYYGFGPFTVDLELDQAYDLVNVTFYPQAGNNPNPDMTMAVYDGDPDAGGVQIGSTYTCATFVNPYVVNNGGAGYAGAKWIRWSKPTALWSLYEVQAFIDLTFVSVDAGASATIDYGTTHQLDATVYDAHGPVSYQWSIFAGPSDGTNIALLGTATGGGSTPEMTIDDSLSGLYVALSPNGWLEIELDATHDIGTIEIFGQNQGNETGTQITVYDGDPSGSGVQIGTTETLTHEGTTLLTQGWDGAKWVRVNHPGGHLACYEVRVTEKSSFTPVVTFDPNANVEDPIASFSPSGGNYILQLDVNDGTSTASDTVVITVIPPIFALDAGDPNTVVVNEPSQLDSSVQWAAGPVSYQWSVKLPPTDGTNVAPTGYCNGVSNYGLIPDYAIDDNLNTFFYAETGVNGYCELDLWEGFDIARININTQGGCPDRLYKTEVKVYDSSYNQIGSTYQIMDNYIPLPEGIDIPRNGADWSDVQYVLVEQNDASRNIAISELQVWTVSSLNPIVTWDPNANVADPVATFNAVGDWVLQLDANDGSGELTDTVAITVTTASAMDAGDNIGVVASGPVVVQLDASVEFMPTPVSYSWSYIDYYYYSAQNVARLGLATGNGLTPASNAIDGTDGVGGDVGGLYYGPATGDIWWDLVLPAAYDLEYITFLTQPGFADRTRDCIVQVFDIADNQIGSDFYVPAQGPNPEDWWNRVDNGGAGFTGAKRIHIVQTTSGGDYYMCIYELYAFTMPSPAWPSVTFDSNTIEDPTITIGSTAPANEGLVTLLLDVNANDGEWTGSDIVRVKVLPAGYNQGVAIASATATSSTPNSTASDAIAPIYAAPDGIYQTVGNDPCENWVSNAATNVADQAIELVLPSKYDLNYIRLYNLSADAYGFDNAANGVKDVIVLAKENVGDEYVQIGTLTARAYPETQLDRDMSEVFALDDSALTNGVGYVKLDIESNLAGNTVGKVGLSHIILSGSCVGGDVAGDIDNDCDVDLDDFAALAAQWLNTDCSACGGANLEGSDGDVDYADLKVITDNWLQ